MKVSFVHTAIILVASSFLLAGCPGGGGGGDITVGGGGSSTGSFSITVDTVYPDSVGPSWTPATSAGAFYFKSGLTAVDLAGTCSRGVETIKAYINSSATPEAETTTCQPDNTYIWKKTFPTSTLSTGDIYSIVLKGYDAAGTEVTSATATSVVIDTITPTVAPAFNNLIGPTYNLISSNSYSVQSTAITVTGTWDGTQALALSKTEVGATGTLTATNCGTTSCTFSYTATLTEGTPLLLTIVATDIAGNQTSSTTVTLNYLATSSFIAYDAPAAVTLAEGGWHLYSSPSGSGDLPYLQASISGFGMGDNSPLPSVGGAADTAYFYIGFPSIISTNP